MPLRLELLRYAHEVPTPRAKLRREHSDAGAVTNEIRRIEHVENIEANGDGLFADNRDFARQAEVHLSIGRHVIDVEIAGPQPAAIDHVGADAGAVPDIGHAARCGIRLGVVGEDPAVGDEGELIGAEKLLVRYDIGCPLDRPGQIAIEAERAIPVLRTPLDAVVFALLVVERGQYVGRAELTVIDQVFGDLVIAVDANLEAVQKTAELLRRADVEDVRTLRQNRTVLQSLRLCRSCL